MLLAATRPEIVDFGGLGRLRRPQNPSEKVGGFASHLLDWFPGPPGPPRPPKSKISDPLKTNPTLP